MRPTRKSLVSLIAATLFLIASAGLVAAAPVEVTFQTYPLGHPYGDGMKLLIDEFNRMQSEVYVTQIADNSDLPDKFLVTHAGGATPDIVWHHLTGDFVQADGVIPLNRYLEFAGIEDWVPRTTQFNQQDGSIYGVPYGLLGQPVILYNQEMIQARGVPAPTEGWTWADLESMSRVLTRDTSGDGEPDIFGFDMGPWFWFLPFLVTNDTWLYDGERWFPNRERAEEALAFHTRLAQEGLSPNGAGRGLSSFVNGGAAFLAGASRNVELFRDGEAPFQAGAIHFPVNRSRGIVLSTRSFHLGNTGDPARQDAAWKFIRWALEPQQQMTFFWASNLLPSRLTALQLAAPDIEERDPLLIAFVNEVSSYGYPYPSVPAFGRVISITYEWAQKAISGEVPPRTAIENIIQLSNAL